MLNALGSKFLINVPTRFSKSSKPSLLDHIYSNTTKKELISKPCLFEISDPLPTCLIIENFSAKKQSNLKLKRCMKSFDIEKFIFDLNDQILNTNHLISSDSNVNISVIKISEAFMNTLNKHAHCRCMSRREKKLNEKPWITRGILKSIKTKNRLFKFCYKCLDSNKIEFYKKYRNKLTHIKFLAKRQKYDQVL